MTNVRGYAFMQDFTLKIKELPKRNEENCLFGFLLQNRKVYFPPIRIGCPYDVCRVGHDESKNSWIKVIY